MQEAFWDFGKCVCGLRLCLKWDVEERAKLHGVVQFYAFLLLHLLLRLLLFLTQVQDTTWPPLRHADFDVSLTWVVLLLVLLLWTHQLLT